MSHLQSIETLGKYFPKVKEPNHKVSWPHAAPLLALIETNRTALAEFQEIYPTAYDPEWLLKNLNTICDTFIQQGIIKNEKMANPYYYRLPILISEIPLKAKEINEEIKQFNELIENYHKRPADEIDQNQLNTHFINILNAIKKVDRHSCPESLAQLISMMRGWLPEPPDLPTQPSTPPTVEEDEKKSDIPIPVMINILTSQKKDPVIQGEIFIPEDTYPFNHAGLITDSNKLLLNAFAFKFGGHFDAKETKPPKLIPLDDFYTLLWRHLQHRVNIPLKQKMTQRNKSNQELKELYEHNNKAQQYYQTIMNTLCTIGARIENTEAPYTDQWINPLSKKKQVSINHEQTKKDLRQAAEFNQLTLEENELTIISDQINHILFGMQFSNHKALGIGADDDGTVRNSTENTTYAFQFKPEYRKWAARFAQLSLHRQGSAQAKMDASIGIAHELAAAFANSFEQMTQIQPDEYWKIIYTAIIDNLVADSLPNTDYFPNTQYAKYQRHFILNHHNQLTSYMKESKIGLFKKEGDLVPKIRKAGTVEIHALARDHESQSKSILEYSQGDHLIEQKIQYEQSLLEGTRGDIAYHPTQSDVFLLNVTEGQLIKNSEGSLVPLIGVIPKNFDKYFTGIEKELCASFVIREMQSAGLYQNCHTFQETFTHQIKSLFLPEKNTIPPLPSQLANQDILHQEHQNLIKKINGDAGERHYPQCEKAFISLFKNIIDRLAHDEITDEKFINFHYKFTRDPDFLSVVSREHCETVLRILDINPPFNHKGKPDEDYLQTLTYLHELIATFYPKPCQATAEKMHQAAKAYATQFVKHKDIQHYFHNLRASKQANLSKNLSPSMALGSLMHQGESTLGRITDLGKMHRDKFRGNFYNFEGNTIVQPTSEWIADWFMKKVSQFAALLQHDHNPLKPFFKRGYLRFSQIKKWIDVYKPGRIKYVGYILLGIPAGLLGFAIEGSIFSVFTSLDAVRVFFVNIFYPKPKQQPLIKDNALIIAASPSNEPGFKVKTSNHIRDLLLQTKIDNETGRYPLVKKLRDIALDITLTANTNQHINNEDRIHAIYTLINENSLDEKEWEIFSTPLSTKGVSPQIDQLFLIHPNLMNTLLIASAHRCFLIPREIKKTKKQLSRAQKPVLDNLMNIFNQASTETQEKLKTLFSYQGDLDQQLKRKDQVHLKLYDITMQTFNIEIMKIFALEKWEKDYQKKSISYEKAKEMAKKLPSAQAQDLEHVIMSPPTGEIKEIKNEIRLLLDEKTKLNNLPLLPTEKKAAFIKGIDEDIFSANEYMNQLIQKAIPHASFLIALGTALQSKTEVVTELKTEAKLLIDTPVIEQKSSHEKWIAPKETEKLFDYVKKISVFQYSILHKAFKDFELAVEQYQKQSSDINEKITNEYYALKNMELYYTVKKLKSTLQTYAKLKSSPIPEGFIDRLDSFVKNLTFSVCRKKEKKKSAIAPKREWYHTIQTEDEKVLSIRDKEHNKLTLIYHLALHHELLPQKEKNVIMDQIRAIPIINQADILKKSFNSFCQATEALYNKFEESDQYAKPIDVKAIDDFYHAFTSLKKNIEYEKNLKPEAFPANLIDLLNYFFNISMNAIVNKQLDRIDQHQPENALIMSEAICDWLLSQNIEDRRHLFAQQNNQPSLQKSMIRKIFLRKTLEILKGITPSHQKDRIHGTGLRRDLLFFSRSYDKAVSKTGALTDHLGYDKVGLPIEPIIQQSALTNAYRGKM